MKNNSIDFNSPSFSPITSHEIEIGGYILKQTIGEGAFSKVKLAIQKDSNSLVAIKIIDKSKMSQDDEVRIKREIQILSTLDHPNVITVNEIFENPNCYYIVMEYCPEGELFSYIVNKKRLSEEESSLLFYQIISGLEYIHNNGISHRDLKPENILLLSNRTIKIIDFGLSNNLIKNKLLKTPCGSPSYAAPETIKNEDYDGKAIDIWSAGIVLYAMICGYLPFEDDNDQQLFAKILRNKPQFPKFVSVNAKDLINKMITKDQNKRITMDEIKFHPFYIQGRNIFNLKFTSTYDDLYKIKNLTAGSIAAYPTDRNSKLEKNSEPNEDAFCFNDALSEDVDFKENDGESEELIYEKEVMPTYEAKAPPITKLIDYLEEANCLNNNENEIKNNTDNNNIIKEDKIIKVNKRNSKNDNNNNININNNNNNNNSNSNSNSNSNKESKGIKVPPINLPITHYQPVNNFGLTTYNMFRDKIALSKQTTSKERKPKIATIMNITEMNKICHNTDNKKNMSFRMGVINLAHGRINTSIEVEEFLSNRKPINKKVIPQSKIKNMRLLSQDNMKNKKKRMNQSIDQEAIIEKFYKKFNLKIRVPSNNVKNIGNKNQKTSKIETHTPRVKEKKCFNNTSLVKKKNKYAKIKAKVDTNLDKIETPTGRNISLLSKGDKTEKNNVCNNAKSFFVLKEKIYSYRAPNLTNKNSMKTKPKRLASQAKQRIKV